MGCKSGQYRVALQGLRSASGKCTSGYGSARPAGDVALHAHGRRHMPMVTHSQVTVRQPKPKKSVMNDSASPAATWGVKVAIPTRLTKRSSLMRPSASPQIDENTVASESV